MLEVLQNLLSTPHVPVFAHVTLHVALRLLNRLQKKKRKEKKNHDEHEKDTLSQRRGEAKHSMEKQSPSTMDGPNTSPQ